MTPGHGCTTLSETNFSKVPFFYFQTIYNQRQNPILPFEQDSNMEAGASSAPDKEAGKHKGMTNACKIK
jgi:hypothetical protein